MSEPRRIHRLAIVIAAGLAALGIALPASSSAAGATPGCGSATTVNWIAGTGNGAAGTIYYSLEFTNLSSHRCTLRGFPGVSGVNLRGRRVGSAARRAGGAVHTVTLRHGQTVTANLGIIETGDFSPASCRPQLAAGLRVYAPGQRAGKIVPFPYSACSHGQTNLTVGPVTYQAQVPVSAP